MTTTFSVRALDLARTFQEKTRDNGDSFYFLPESAPAWMHELVRAAHHDELPNDWRFAKIRELAYSLAEYESANVARDSAGEIAQAAASVYTGTILGWYADIPSRLDYVTEWREAMGTESRGGILDELIVGQYYCLEQMAHEIIDTSEARAEELETVKS